MLGRIRDDSEDLVDEIQGHPGVNQVAHRVDEHDERQSPFVGIAESADMGGDAETGTAGPRVAVVLVLGLPHRLQSLRQGQRVKAASEVVREIPT